VGGAFAAAVVFSGSPTGRGLAFGAVAGALSVVALGALYQGLALGRMGIVAPVTAVVGACIPVAWGLAHGEDPSTVALVGVALAIVAGGLLAREHDTATGGGRRARLVARGPGVNFGAPFCSYVEAPNK